MSRRSAFMLFFITILSGELVVTGLSLVFDSIWLLLVPQPLVLISGLFVVGLVGGAATADAVAKRSGRRYAINDASADEICDCCAERYSVEPPLECGLGCKPCGSCIGRERSKNARTSDS